MQSFIDDRISFPLHFLFIFVSIFIYIPFYDYELRGVLILYVSVYALAVKFSPK